MQWAMFVMSSALSVLLCREVICVRNFKEGNYIQCVAYDPNGHYIGKLRVSPCHHNYDNYPLSHWLVGVGFTNGLVGVLDSVTLEDVCQPFRYSKDAVTLIVFSRDSTYMATAVS